MATEFKLPELGEGVDQADISEIYVSEGDQIDADQNIMELETEKAVADLPCPHAGKVSKIHVAEGDTIEVGQTLLTIEEVGAEEREPDDGDEEEDDEQRGASGEQEEEAGEERKTRGEKAETEEEEAAEESDEPQRHREEAGSGEAKAGEDAKQKDKQQQQQQKKKESEEGEQDRARAAGEGGRSEEVEGQGNGKRMPPPAGPATRRLARQLEVDLDDFEPPEGGRIRQEDVVRAYVESGKAARLTTEPLPDFTRFGPIDHEPLDKIAQTAARRLTAAWHAIPHVTQHALADVTDLEVARRQYMERAAKSSPKITLTSIALKSVAGLLKEFPKFNASLDTDHDQLILKKHYHIGVAVDTAHGLLVPVIRDVDRKSIEQIATELLEVAERARQRRLGKEDFEGGTFTVSNQGGIGGGAFTPIVNYPEVAILGMGRARPELRLVDGRAVERSMLPLSLSYDHRVINGADAARFIDRLATILSDEFTLLIAT